jgi:CheY-like chemotaxis protein
MSTRNKIIYAAKPKDFDKLGEVAHKYPFTILIVEDNIINQKLITNLFKLLEYKADLATNGIEALEALKKKNYDLIFMDIQMPHMNGYEATKIIIEHSKEDRPFIIAMTASAMAGDRDKCLEAGMDDYITKPMKIEALIHIIQLWGNRKFPDQKN